MNVPFANRAALLQQTGAYAGNVNVMVTFRLNNQTELNTFLAAVSDPGSSLYHHYITGSDFARLYGPTGALYTSAEEYFHGFAGVRVSVYRDRVSISVNGPSAVIGRIFNTDIATFSRNGSAVYAPVSNPMLPAYIAKYVSHISGLNNFSVAHAMGGSGVIDSSGTRSTYSPQNGYPQPIVISGVQYIYGSAMQVAYDEQSLLNATYPTHQVIATILWTGNNGTSPTAPFYPADIYAYYNATLPSYEPHAKVYGVPINGAPEPGISAQYDTSGAVFENTLDLEMVGSSAPGSSVFNVYGPTATSSSIDNAFAYILNPNASFPQLNNVSVISNSWGSGDYNDSTFMTYLQEAQARGITVLASSGDSGDNNLSTKFTGGPDLVQFPSAMAYNSFGVTAVGGTTVTLNTALKLQSDIAWYISANDTGDGGPAGSTGGISSVFAEPSWQLNTEANKVINGQGRATPDVSAIANNTIVFITVNRTSYYDNPYFYYAWGTSIASPLVAGMIAEMDALLNQHNQSNLGFLNPTVYNIANLQVARQSNTSSSGYIDTGGYNSTMPLTAFNDVTQGRNHVYAASFAYDLVTGWGSIDAYNLTMYLLSVNYSGRDFALNGVMNSLNISALSVTSYLYNSGTGGYTTVNAAYNASIQQNMFVADALGAPIYWIQNVIYINGSQQSGWTVNYTGWVIFPFYGLYPSETVYEYSFPLGKVITFPYAFTISSWLSNLSSPLAQTMNFRVNSRLLQIPLEGAAFIIGGYNYSYFWQGKSYYDGPYPDNRYPGGLDPQFSLVGGPSGGLGEFNSSTSGNMSSYVEPSGMNVFVPASTAAYNATITQTGETAANLVWVRTSSGFWNFSYSNGSSTQGVLSYFPGAVYNVTFTESGLPAGTAWSVRLSDGQSFGTSSTTMTFTETNGSYSYTVTSVNSSYIAGSGSFVVKGTRVYVSVSFAVSQYAVTFTESGLPSATMWWINLTNGQSFHSTTTTIAFGEPDGTFVYSAATQDKSLNASGGTFSVSGAAVSKMVIFALVTYAVRFAEIGLPAGTGWNIVFSNGQTLMSTASNISYGVPNGTYTYTIPNTTFYYAAPSGGAFTVSGSSVSVTASFLHYAYITGTVLPSRATVTVNGRTTGTAGGSFNVSVASGSYGIVASLSGYRTFYDNVTLQPGKVLKLNIPLTALSTRHTIIPMIPDTYLLIGISLAILLVVAVAAIAASRKRRK